MATNILLVEDDDTLREALTLTLERQGYKVRQAVDGEQALDAARDEPPDLVILDVMLPRLDGLSVCRMLRAEQETTPIILLTARTGEVDKIVGLESGADDYVTKPFSTGELLARIRAVLRRAGAQRSTTTTVLEEGPIRIDLEQRRAFLRNEELTLSPKEFQLLSELLRHPGMALSRDLLLERVWGEDYFGDIRTVDVHIHWLREKIEDDPSHPEIIQTVRGIGYRLEPPGDTS